MGCWGEGVVFCRKMWCQWRTCFAGLGSRIVILKRLIRVVNSQCFHVLLAWSAADRSAGGCSDALFQVNDVGSVAKGCDDRKASGTVCRRMPYHLQQVESTAEWIVRLTSVGLQIEKR